MKSQPSSDVGVVVDERIPGEILKFLKLSQLEDLAPTAVLSVEGSNTAINYSTHGVFRYFGKFPAPIAGHLIESHSCKGQLVIDPACGSGTTGVEALLRGRSAAISDVNPLATLISRVKTRYLDETDLQIAIRNVVSQAKRYRRVELEFETLQEINLDHWFLPGTIDGLAKLRRAIEELDEGPSREFLQVSFASIIRRVSRATSQQGRLFLDVETAVEDVFPVFEKTAARNAARVARLPKSSRVVVETQNLLEEGMKFPRRTALVIFHPPYFNAYKYSSINSLEMAWLGMSRKRLRQSEIREFFKSGKPQNAGTYVEDMTRSLQKLRSQMSANQALCLMIGDTRYQGQYIPVTREILNRVMRDFSIEKVAVRVPRYTEASWAASQRRSGSALGISMYDFLITLNPC